jgi:hypothetical protein
MAAAAWRGCMAACLARRLLGGARGWLKVFLKVLPHAMPASDPESALALALGGSCLLPSSELWLWPGPPTHCFPCWRYEYAAYSCSSQQVMCVLEGCDFMSDVRPCRSTSLYPVFPYESYMLHVLQILSPIPEKKAEGWLCSRSGILY